MNVIVQCVSDPDITIAGITQFNVDVELVAPSTIVVSQVLGLHQGVQVGTRPAIC
jgi:hypothetical protein